MKSALKTVLETLSDVERSKLADVVVTTALANNRFSCPSDCDSHLARINLCPHCQLAEQIIDPIEDALLRIEREAK